MSGIKTARFIRGMVNTKTSYTYFVLIFISMNSLVHNLLKLETIWSTYDFFFRISSIELTFGHTSDGNFHVVFARGRNT